VKGRGSRRRKGNQKFIKIGQVYWEREGEGVMAQVAAIRRKFISEGGRGI
jgi:hypothetical protein